ncbi:MAG: DNA repair protein RecO C-terminal domain-containing protein [Treponema sp.]|jgi:DNA repair protein RecO (recombination protein O)|nr:DNA repair protein RecO C-terminal domain-containing protein [Treponema sp.]
MSRSFTYPALALRVRPSGESNRDAWFLTSGEGVIRATVFGGPKSKLRAHISPFHTGTLWIYHDPSKDSRKVTDFDVRSWRPGLRERYERSMAASSLAETVLATQGGGGNWDTALALANNALDALDSADEACCTRIVIHFLWNWALFLGIGPDLDRCAACACEPSREGILWFSKREGVLLCPACADAQKRAARDESLVPVMPGARRWLATVEKLPPAWLARYMLDARSLAHAKALVTNLMALALGRWLATWDVV